VAWQVAVPVVPVGERVQVPPGENAPPAGDALKLTVPVGVLLAPEALSLTVAVHVVVVPAARLVGTHETDVEVDRGTTLIGVFPADPE
jgi:hypothetical protein